MFQSPTDNPYQGEQFFLTYLILDNPERENFTDIFATQSFFFNNIKAESSVSMRV